MVFNFFSWSRWPVGPVFVFEASRSGAAFLKKKKFVWMAGLVAMASCCLWLAVCWRSCEGHLNFSHGINKVFIYLFTSGSSATMSKFYRNKVQREIRKAKNKFYKIDVEGCKKDNPRSWHNGLKAICNMNKKVAMPV